MSQATSAYVFITLDDLLLVVLQSQLMLIESAATCVLSQTHAPAVGSLSIGMDSALVYSLDAHLNVVAAVPSTRRMSVVLRAREQALGLLCDEVRMVGEVLVRRHALPQCMASAGSPVQALIEQLGAQPRVGCLVDADQLLSHIATQAKTVLASTPPSRADADSTPRSGSQAGRV